MTSFNDVSLIVFDNDNFWRALGSARGFTHDAFRNLHNMLSLSKALREELLEKPSAANANKQSKAQPRRKPSQGAARQPRIVVRAEELLFKQPQSLLHRAVHAVFVYNPLNAYATSMSVSDASRQFAVSKRKVQAIIERLAVDPSAEGYDAARYYRRVTVLSMLPAVLHQTGGLRHIAKTNNARAKATKRSALQFITVIEDTIATMFVPLIRKARPLVKDTVHKQGKLRLVGYYKALRKEIRSLRDVCRESRENADFRTTRACLSHRLSHAKLCARRLDHAHAQLLSRIALAGRGKGH